MRSWPIFAHNCNKKQHEKTNKTLNLNHGKTGLNITDTQVDEMINTILFCFAI